MNLYRLKEKFQSIRLKLGHIAQDFSIRKYQTIVVDTTTVVASLEKKTKLNLIIAPSLYWSQEAKLNVKNPKEALKFAASLFDFLPQEVSYQYKIFENDKKLILIAFDPEQIVSKIKELGIPVSRIKNIFFAQSEFCVLQSPLKITQKHSLIVQDGIVYSVPTSLCGACGSLDEFMFGHYFSSNAYSYEDFEEESIDNKTMITSWVLFGIAIGILFFNWNIYNQELKALLVTKEETIKTYGLDNSIAKVTAIKNSLLKKEQKQINIRQKIGYIMGLNLEATGATPIETSGASGSFIAPGTNELLKTLASEFEDKEFIKKLEFEKNEILLVLLMKDDKRAEYIKDYLKQKFKIDSIEAKNKIVTAKVEL